MGPEKRPLVDEKGFSACGLLAGRGEAPGRWGQPVPRGQVGGAKPTGRIELQ